MNEFDEYQRMMRYRNGDHAFFLTILLLLMSFFTTEMLGIEWAESKSTEYIFIITIPIAYLNIRNTWQGSYYKKKENALWNNLALLASGLVYIYIFQSNPNGSGLRLLENGKITSDAGQLFWGLTWIAIPLTYFIRYFIDKKNNE